MQVTRIGLSPSYVQRTMRALSLRSGVLVLMWGLVGRFTGALHLAALVVGRFAGVLHFAALLELAGGFALSAMIDAFVSSLGGRFAQVNDFSALLVWREFNERQATKEPW